MARSAAPPGNEESSAKSSISPDLGKREHEPDDYEQRHGKPAGDSSDPRGESSEEGADGEKKALADLKSGDDSTAQGSSTGEPGVQSKSLYKGQGAKLSGFSGRLTNSKNFKKYLILGGFGAGMIAAIIALVSFLGVFKLDGLMSSIESRAFLRNNAVLDTRSSKLMSAYVEARMMDMGDNPNFDNPDFKKDDNLLFRADRVDTNNPFFDWYKTMRASKFEQDVFNKDGIKFTSMVTADGKLRPGKITLSDSKTIPFNVSDISDADFEKLSQGDVATIQKFGNIVDSHAFSGNKEARLEIKSVVKKNTYWYEAWKRRALRKSIQNMTGVKDWRFFETRRDKAAQTRIDIRNKILNKMVPDTNMLGKVTRCLFGVDKCSANRDVASESNHADTNVEIGTEDPNPPDDTKKVDPKVSTTWDPGQMSDFLKKILTQANLLTKIASLPSTLDMLSSVNHNIKNIVKLVVVARGAQAAGLFQEFETSRDQLKTGQVTSGEVNLLMQTVDTAGNSDAQNRVIEGNGDPSTSYSQGACSQSAQALYAKDPVAYLNKYSNYGYLCDNQKIGSAANAQKIESDYKNTIGRVIGPIADAWDGANSTPILGTVISVVRWVGDKISGLQDAVVNSVLDALGLHDDVNDLIAYLFGKVTAFLGVAILNGSESGGTIFNWLVQGASYASESAGRQEGAAVTTPDSKAAAQSAIGLYQGDQQNASLYDRVASLDNTNSLAFRGAMTLESVKSDPGGTVATSVGSIFNSFGKNLAMAFGRNTFAATPNGYAASSFAGIETYDYPPKCYSMDPITTTPINGTNALVILQQNGIQPSQDHLDALNSWGTEKDSDKFYALIYSIINDDGHIKDNADDIAVKIYNCNLLDSTVRDSLGYTHGYSAGPDFDVATTAPADATATNNPPTDATTTPPIVVDGYAWPVDIPKSDVDSGYPWPCPGNCHHDNTPAFDLSTKETVAGGNDASAIGKAEFAITAGTIDNLHIYMGHAGCYSFHIKSSLDGYDYYYTHTRNPVVKDGQTVVAGQKVSEIGERVCTDNGSYPHLHIDRGSPKGSPGGNVCCRDSGLVPIMNKLYADLPS